MGSACHAGACARKPHQAVSKSHLLRHALNARSRRAFGSPWDLRLGRIDSDELPPGRALAPGAGTEEMRDFMYKLGAKPGDDGPFSAKPPFWERPAFVIYSAMQDDPVVRPLASEHQCVLSVLKAA